jgi:hypothetical protein
VLEVPFGTPVEPVETETAPPRKPTVVPALGVFGVLILVVESKRKLPPPCLKPKEILTMESPWA